MAILIPAGDYEFPLDIANAACDHLGAPQITAFTGSKLAVRLGFRYDKVRKYELQRNLWVHSIRKAIIRPISTSTGLVTFGIWNVTATYILGSIAKDPTTNKLYQAKHPVAANFQPSVNPQLWEEYFGPTTCDPWTLTPPGGPQPWSSSTNYAAGVNVVGSDSNSYLGLTNGNQGNNPVTDGGVHWQLVGPAPVGGGYYAGELVYVQVGTTLQVFLSLSSNNVSSPLVYPAWVSTQVYNFGDTVVPTTTPITYNGVQVTYGGVAATYGAGAILQLFQSPTDFNVGQDPLLGVGWSAVPATQVDLMVGSQWLLLGAATLSSFQVIYPLGAGPVSDTRSLNVYKLPYGFLREAPQDPKDGQLTWLGGPSNKIMLDWVYENGFITTSNFTPINFRFGADVNDVSKFDGMFCELFAARLALEASEVITQSAQKKAAIGAEYARWGFEARTRNGIEIGPQEEYEDELISVRR